MSFGESTGNSVGTDGAKVLVWGAVGDELKKLDKKRMMALIQDDPDFFLSVITNRETDILLDKLDKLEESDNEGLPEDIKEYIREINKLDAIFSEATKFLHESNDMLATGSFITGEFEQKQAILKTMGVVERNENNRSDKGMVPKPKINAVPLSS